MTPRQASILYAIVSEFMETAEPVGSALVTEKYKIKASPATVRNEMSDLVNMGYLEKEHFSAGREPTSLGLRYFLEQLMELEEMSYQEEMEIKQSLHNSRFQKDELIRRTVEFLADNTNYASIALVAEHPYIAGIHGLLDYEQLQDVDTIRSILSIVENPIILKELFTKGDDQKDVKVLLGEESGYRTFKPCAVVYANFRFFNDDIGYVSIFGPINMKYAQVLPILRCVSETLSLATRGW